MKKSRNFKIEDELWFSFCLKYKDEGASQRIRQLIREDLKRQ